MGGIISKKDDKGRTDRAKQHDMPKEEHSTRLSMRDNGSAKTNAKVVSMLTKKKGEVDKSGHTMTFEKYVLHSSRLSLSLSLSVAS